MSASTPVNRICSTSTCRATCLRLKKSGLLQNLEEEPQRIADNREPSCSPIVPSAAIIGGEYRAASEGMQRTVSGEDALIGRWRARSARRGTSRGCFSPRS